MTAADDTSHSYLKSLLENSPDGVFTIDLDLAIRYVNPAFCRLLGFTAAQLLGSSITEHLGDLDILSTCMAEVDATGHCNDQETIFKRADGSVVHISKNVQAIYGARHEVREILVTIRDMTELHALNRRLEQTLAERERTNAELQQALDTLQRTQRQLLLAEKMAALGSLVAGVAHELNTPIGVCVTVASTLQEEARKLDGELGGGTLRRSTLDGFVAQTREGSALLAHNLARAADLISSFKQVAADQSADVRREFDLQKTLHEIDLTLQPTCRKTPFALVLDLAPGIRCDSYPGALAQVVTGLVSNALSHAFAGRDSGTMRLVTRPLDDDIEIVFSDDGVGIAPENLGRVFDPFFTTRMGQGHTGLGLNIAYNIVGDVLGGEIGVDSRPGAGTTFRIRMPRRAPRRQGEAAA